MGRYRSARRVRGRRAVRGEGGSRDLPRRGVDEGRHPLCGGSRDAHDNRRVALSDRGGWWRRREEGVATQV